MLGMSHATRLIPVISQALYQPLSNARLMSLATTSSQLIVLVNNRFQDAPFALCLRYPRRVKARTCLECGDPFRTKRSSRRHCSRGCQRAARRKRTLRMTRALARVTTTRRVVTPEIRSTYL
jgi:hypothetical protein